MANAGGARKKKSDKGKVTGGGAASAKSGMCEGCKGCGRRPFVVQEEVSAAHVIASEAKQSPMPSVEIASPASAGAGFAALLAMTFPGNLR
jgi:hypothetical protein